MTLRSDHVAGGAFVVLGVVVLALSGNLPMGQLSMPGSGFLPKILAVLIILSGLALMLRGHESEPVAETSWSDGRHAATVTIVSAAAIALYTMLGFILSMALMMIALLIFSERRNPLMAIGYSGVIVVLTYVCFEYLLTAPLPGGFFSY
jgi:hypothetical protein